MKYIVALKNEHNPEVVVNNVTSVEAADNLIAFYSSDAVQAFFPVENVVYFIRMEEDDE